MASYYNENTVLWLNGAFVKAAEAKMVPSQSLHYGYSVFEGINFSYKTFSGETKIFKEVEHF